MIDGVVEVSSVTGAPARAGSPTSALCRPTRAGPSLMTTCERVSVPLSVRSRSVWKSTTAAVVAEVQSSSTVPGS